MKIELGEWVKLHELREGALFETRSGNRAVKSEYHYPWGGIQCVLIASGEYAHFGKVPSVHNYIEVRELIISSDANVEDRKNGGIVCDTPEGPCACGAWHT